MLYALICLFSIPSQAVTLPPNEARNYIQAVRIVSTGAPAGYISEVSDYVLDVAAFNLIASTSVAYTNQPNTFTSTQTLTANAFSVGGSSFTVSGGSVTVAYNTQTGSLNLQNVKSGTQCLHADSSGNITGSGADCGSGGSFTGGTVANLTTFQAGVVTSTEVITSTLTVQGNSFSVGGSSFTVAGGSATVAYSLTAGSLAMSGPTTLSSTTVNGNLGINTANGISMGTSITTATPCGTVFSISSMSITGSSDTVGTGRVIFSSWPYQGGSIYSTNQALIIKCLFQNSGTAPTTPLKEVFFADNNITIASGNSTTASNYEMVTSEIRYFQPGAYLALAPSGYQCSTGNGQCSSTTQTVGGGSARTRSIDWTQNHTFNCSASVASGGPENFVMMIVSYACQ